ncbi:hypothetical protein KXV45_007388 [Aspergillus fumigatus]|nr:hypothetical protein KXX04_004108 [Aspergillus fumigatus]KAH2027948.1 hypothetical protein KXV45_007388 [Aspergillus fumigatus]KAH2170742.1 hypothetical protein KXW37_002376 [Aspergillus fumigatus]
MAGDKPEVSEIGFVEGPSSKPSFGRRVLNHYKRWWWVHIIAIIVVVLVVTLPFQTLDLSDVGAFGGFATAVMQNEEIKLNIYGKPDLKQGGLPKIDVTYNKTVTMKALNKLEGFAITEMHALSGKSANGANFGGTVYIPNPSPMTISMGNVTLDLSCEGTSIGTSYLNDLKLVPGNNTLPMTTAVKLSAIAPFFDKYPNGLPVSISGSSTNSSVYNGQAIPYFSEALASNTLEVTLDLAKLLT